MDPKYTIPGAEKYWINSDHQASQDPIEQNQDAMLRAIIEESNQYAAKDSTLPYEVDISKLGLSLNPFEDAIQAAQKALMSGARHMELSFFGTGKGSKQRGNITPECYGKEERQSLKDLLDHYNVTLSTHAAPAAQGFAGFTGQGFDDQTAERNINEVRRAIDFAGDATHGGAIVVHLGEFTRGLYEKFGEEGFSSFQKEREKAQHYVVDTRTGNLAGIRNDEVIYMPRKINDEDASEDNRLKDNGLTLYQTDENGNIILDRLTFEQYKTNVLGDETDSDELAKQFFREQQAAQKEHQLGMALQYEQHYTQGLKERDKIADTLSQYRTLKASLGPDQYERFMQEMNKRYQFVPGEMMGPVEYLEQVLKDNERSIAYGRETAISGRRQAAQIDELIGRIENIEEYAIGRTAESLSRLGMYAMHKTQEKELDEPLFISGENMFPDTYGSHPAELMSIIERSREKMVDKLVKEGYSNKEAHGMAKEHIKATLDIGHLNTWFKHFDGTKEEFDKWAIDWIDKLGEKSIIGEAHITDNFGFEDEHNSPGHGNAPIKPFVAVLKKHGIDNIMIETAHQGSAAYGEALKILGGPIASSPTAWAAQYANQATQPERWIDVGNYFCAERTGRPRSMYDQPQLPHGEQATYSGVELH